MNERLDYVVALMALLREHGASPYGRGQVCELEHAVQTAMLARASGASCWLTVAALFHDIGQLVLKATVGEAAVGIDNKHEDVGASFLSGFFPAKVTEPVRLHVAAKRYLFATDAGYRAKITPVARSSMEREGGALSTEECRVLERLPFFEDAVRVRRWDDEAMNSVVILARLEEFEQDIMNAMRSDVRAKLAVR